VLSLKRPGLFSSRAPLAQRFARAIGMTQQLKPGDRVRVRANVQTSKLRPGDKGTVQFGPIQRAHGEPYYLVRLDGNDFNTICSVDEIEPDV
jgi:hypothetical protein